MCAVELREKLAEVVTFSVCMQRVNEILDVKIKE